MSEELMKNNYESRREFNLRLSLKEFSPIRKTDFKIDCDEGKKKVEAESPNTPATLPNSTFRSFSAAALLKKKPVGFSQINEITSSIANLDLKIQNNLQILENTFKKNNELNQKIRILEQKRMDKKLIRMRERVDTGCSNNCIVW